MPLTNYFNCNCCLFAQDLLEEFLNEASLGIPEEEKVNYIDCHLHLHERLTDKMPEFNLKHRESVGCRGWVCGECGVPGTGWNGHEKCWDK